MHIKLYNIEEKKLASKPGCLKEFCIKHAHGNARQ